MPPGLLEYLRRNPVVRPTLARSLVAVQPMPQPASQIFYMQDQGPDWGRWLRGGPLVEFTAGQLGLTEVEEHLFFGLSVLVRPTVHSLMTWKAAIELAVDGGSRVSLWDATWPPKERGWSLVECLRSTRPKLSGVDLKYPLVLRLRDDWVWIQGELDAERVRRGLSLWGVLEHSRREEVPAE